MTFYNPYFRRNAKYLIPKIFEKKVEVNSKVLKSNIEENIRIKEQEDLLRMELYQQLQIIKKLKKEHYQLRLLLSLNPECADQDTNMTDEINNSSLKQSLMMG
eukprot:CAMPEP_0176434690 /NCGR_PEP_ID=MMETSP0127-20121128/16837_1 /TAXON_ID=938130 /ORGANISM="Platyophrya macrostoma, Strain WH" /LENGTH=102 /DNA_ID=CAMNT_0017817495 /DNA_START=302 /DNA_END=610 /DNA_ORIENTATION=+